MTWQDEVTPTQWAEWQDVARRTSKDKKMHKSLGPEDYAVLAQSRKVLINLIIISFANQGDFDESLFPTENNTKFSVIDSEVARMPRQIFHVMG